MTKRFGFAFLLFLAALARADFNFMVQGRLSDGEGNPIGVQTAVEWRLFRGGDPAVEAGTPVYREAGFITPVNSLGVFSYELGSGIPLDGPLDVSAYAGSQPIYALLVVGGSPLLPKLRVTPVPRAHVAAVAESVQADGVDTPALKNAAVTGPKIADGAISGNHLNPSAQLNVDRIGLGGAPATSLDLGAKTDAVRLPLGTIAQRPAAPANGDTRYNSETNSLESYVNGAWQSLSTNAGTVTTVTASTPLASSGGTTPVLSIPQADGATGGYLASADWTTFNAKLAPALTAGQIFVGNDSNTATGQPLSGDATLSSAGALTLASTGTAGTYTKVTTDAKGRVTAGAALDAADIPNLDAAKITSGTIDPARIPAGTDSGKLPLAGGTMSGAIDMAGNNITNAGTLGAGSATVTGGLTAGSVVANTGITAASATVSGALTADSLAAATSATVGGHAVLTTTSTLSAASVSGDIAGNAANVTGTVAIDHGGTGATDAPTARANLSAAVSGANADITSLAGLTTPLSVTQGGIGSTTTTQNHVFSAPDNADGAPSFRALVSTDIPNLDASKTNSGVFDTARIPDLDAAKITSGVLDAARIPAGSNGSDRLPLAGGTMTGAIDMAGYNITNAATVAASSVTVGGNPVVVAPAPLTSGSVLFATGASSAGQDNSNLFWDNTNKRLGVGTASPTSMLDIANVENVGSNLVVGRIRGIKNNNSGSTILRLTTDGLNGLYTTDIEQNTGNGGFRYGTVVDTNFINAYNHGTHPYGNINFLTGGPGGTAIAMIIGGGTQKGNIGIGTTSPTAVLHLKAGTATANRAPLKFTAGTNLTTPEAGAVEFDGTDLYFSTNTTTRKTFAFQGSAGTLSGLTSGSVLFATGTASAGQDNTNLFWDNTNKRLGVGTATPSSKFEVVGGNISLNTNGQSSLFSTYFGANSDGENLFLGGGGQSSVGEGGATYKGGYNTSVGINALYSNTTGYNNTAQGTSALYSNTTGLENTAQGVNALYSNTTGNWNTAQGVRALFNNNTGYNNTAQGRYALYYNTAGYQNTAIGRATGFNLSNEIAQYRITTDSNMTLVGYGATKDNAAALTNGTAIGAGAHVLASNQVVLGNDAVTTTLLKGNVGIGTTSPTAKLHLSSGTATANTAPLKFTAGTNLTTPEAGAVEFDGTDLYFSTDSATRKTFAFQGSAGTLSGLTAGSVLFANGSASAGQDNSNLFWDNTNKRLGIGTTSPGTKLDVSGGTLSLNLGADSGADTRTNSTIKAARISGVHYRSAEEPVVMMFLDCDSGDNYLNIGGGTSLLNTATRINFYTALNYNTVTGSKRMTITNTGNVGIGTSTPSGLLDVNQPTAGSVAIQAQSSPTVFWKVVNPAGGITGGYNAADAVEYVAKDTGTGRSINAAGTINASGADFAEWVDWEGSQPEMGSIVKYRGAYVVVSSPGTAAFVGNDVKDPRHAILVAFAGQLPVWVKGPVREGDLIVANGDGTGRAIARDAATLADAQKAVGTAWASSENSGLKRINVAVGIGLNGGSQDVESLKAKNLAKDEKIKQLEKETVEIKLENGEIRQKYAEVSQDNNEIKQKYQEIKNENAEINKRLDQIEKSVAR